jgi:hypothetical protein
VELIQVDHLHAHFPARAFDFRQDSFPCGLKCLARKDQPIAPALDRPADLLLAVAVPRSRVDERHPKVQSPADHAFGLVERYPLYWYASEAHGRHLESCLVQHHLTHGSAYLLEESKSPASLRQALPGRN